MPIIMLQNKNNQSHPKESVKHHKNLREPRQVYYKGVEDPLTLINKLHLKKQQ